MSEFTYLYRGGRDIPQSPEQRQKQLQKWAAWFKELGTNGHLKELGHPLESTGMVVKGKEGTSEPVVLSHGTWVFSLAVLADGRLASGGHDGKIKLWPKDGAGEPVVLSHNSQVSSLTMLADGRLVSGGYDRKIKRWSKNGTGEPVVLSHGSWVHSLAVLADGRLASGGRRRKRQALAR